MRNELEVAELQARLAQTRLQEKITLEASNLFNLDETGTRFDRYNYPTGDALNESDYLEMIRNMYLAARTDPFAYGWIETFVKFVVGRDCKLKAKDQSPDGKGQKVLDGMIEGWKWADGRREKPFPHRINEHVRRTFREGESLAQRFVNPGNGRLYFRFLNPMWIASDGRQEANFGVVTKPNDVERVIEYVYWPNGNSPWVWARAGKPEYKDGTTVIHTKIGDSDSKRGWPILQPVMSDLVKLNKLLDARGKRHWLSTLYAVQRIMKGSWPELLKAKHARDKSTVTNTGDGKKERAPEPGSVIEHGENIEYEFKVPNMQNVDADADIRRRGLKIAVGLGFPEYIALGDSANNNYNSGELSESPFVVWMRSWQEFFEPDICLMGEWQLQSAQDAGEIPRDGMVEVRKASADGIVSVSMEHGPRDLRVEVGFPRLVAREIEPHARAIALQLEMGVLDKETAMVDLGYDPQQIRERLRREMAEQKENGDGEEDGVNGEIDRLEGMGRRNGGGAGNGQRVSDLARAK